MSAAELGLERVVLKNQRMIGYFIQDQDSPFYQTPIFHNIIKTVQTDDSGRLKLKEKQTKNGLRLLLTIEQIPNVTVALSQLRGFLQNG